MKLQVHCEHQFKSGFDVAFNFDSKHRITALFGPSGAGKTSLLMMIAGFVVPDKGYIAFDDRVLLDTEAGIALAPESRHLGVVFQDQRLFPHLSVEDNLRFAQRPSPLNREESPFTRIAEVLELNDLLQRRPASLSGGERQRVALGRALMSAPDLMLLDEPVTSVDEPRRETILSYVERVVHEWDVPMLYVSHHRSEVQRVADWILAFDKGRLTEQGPPDKVLGADAVVAAGEPVNLVRLTKVSPSQDGGWLGTVNAGNTITQLRLPANLKNPSKSVFVEFAASDVMLASGNTEGLSARNRLPAIVTDLVPRTGRVFVALEMGEQRLWAEVTTHAIEDLGLVIGSNVTCLIKSAALRVVD